MEKFKKVVDANVGIGNVINGLILGNMETDYTSYEIGDKIVYNFMMDDDFSYWEGLNKNEIKEFVGEGVCLKDKDLSDIWGKDIWYNVSIKSYNINNYGECESLMVEFLADETMCEKI
jgi:hypothetical protein